VRFEARRQDSSQRADQIAPCRTRNIAQKNSRSCRHSIIDSNSAV